MSTVIIACKTIENELLTAMASEQCDYPVLWLESGLHNWPDKLRSRIQELLDSCAAHDRVLLAMSFCGNSVVGLHSHNFRLIIPRCDDCITLLLGSHLRRREIKGTYFLTEGWLTGERNLYAEYRQCLAKYGERSGKRIFSAMLNHYTHLALLDTGCFDRQKVEAEVRMIAAELQLEYMDLEGTLSHLRQLLSGPWPDSRFVVLPPHATVTEAMCTL